MKYFIKNSYLFLILFILIISKDFIFGLFNKNDIKHVNVIENSYIDEINKINFIKNNNFKTNTIYAKIIFANVYSFLDEVYASCDTSLIKKGDLVIDNNYLIGKVDKIYNNYVKIMLVTNKDFKIIGTDLKENYLVSHYNEKLVIKSNDDLNDYIYVSFLTGYNEKIIIGKVSSFFFTPDKYYNIKFKKLNNNYLTILSKGNYDT